MKSIFYLLLAASALFSFSSCGGSHNGKRLEDFSNASAGDSLLYYFGQVKADQYWQVAETDTFLNSPEARRAYLKGIRTALDLIGDDEAFNTGVTTGLQMATNIRSFIRDYGISLNRDVLYQSLVYGLEGPPAEENDTVAEEFYRMLAKVRATSDKQARTKAVKALHETAGSMKMSPIDSVLFKRVDKTGYGKRLTPGLTVRADVRVSQASHDLGLPFPRDMKVGATYFSPLVNNALSSMVEGEKATFLTTANAMFGRRCTQMRLEPQDIITIVISLGQITEASATAPEKPAGQNPAENYENEATPL